jgi:quinol monooxygenase YgiN
MLDVVMIKAMIKLRRGRNVFETPPEKQQALIDRWVGFTEAVRNEPGCIGTALHKSMDGTRVINDAHWRSQANFDAFLNMRRADFAQFVQNASRIDPHTYEVVFIDEPAESEAI